MVKKMENIHPRVRIGTAFECGFNIVIDDDVRIGSMVSLGHGVVLRKGTRVANFVTIDEYTVTGGACLIGENVNIGTGCFISRGVIINDECEIGHHVVIDEGVNIGYGVNIISGTHVKKDIAGFAPEEYLPLAFDVFDRKRYLEGKVGDAETFKHRDRTREVTS